MALNNLENPKIDDIIDFSKAIIYLDIESSQCRGVPKIIQIAGLKIENNKIIDKINLWSNPKEKVSEHILNMVNRSQEFLNGKKSNAYVYKEFLQFSNGIEQIVVFGDFDQRVLDFQSERYSLPSVKLINIQDDFFTKIIKSKTCKISLSSIASIFNIEDYQKDVHNALLDSYMLFNVVQATKKSDVDDLHKKMLFSMIKPRKKIYGNKSEIKIEKVEFKLDLNFKLNYFNIEIQKELIPEHELTYIKRIKCTIKQFHQNGKISKELEKEHFFNFDNQNEVEVKINEFCQIIIAEYEKNSIFIYQNNFKYYINSFLKNNNSLPIYNYIPSSCFEFYVKNIYEMDSIIEFFMNKKLFESLISLIKHKFLFINNK